MFIIVFVRVYERIFIVFVVIVISFKYNIIYKRKIHILYICRWSVCIIVSISERMVGDFTEIGFYEDMLEEDDETFSFRTKFSSEWRLKVWIIRRVYTSAYTYVRCPLCNSLQNAFRMDHRRCRRLLFQTLFSRKRSLERTNCVLLFYNLFLFVESNRCHIIPPVLKRIGYIQRVRFNWKTSNILKNMNSRKKCFAQKSYDIKGVEYFTVVYLTLRWSCNVLRTSY